ncbi:MAG: hypothetical protein IT436_15720 [Phycisphaerales bacterium]|nr:hypothetical protein [Phycisphaerales bacterium]
MDKNKLKLIIAVGVLIVAGAILAWYFMGRSGAGTASTPLEEAPPDAVGSRALAPGAKTK